MRQSDTPSDGSAGEVRADYLSIGEVATLLGVTRATLYRWMALGLPSHQPGGPNGRRLFDTDEVQAWVKSRCTRPSPGQGTDPTDEAGAA